MHILLVSLRFPPLLSAESIMTLKTLLLLDSLGYEITVVTPDFDETPYPLDYSLSRFLPGKIRIIRTGKTVFPLIGGLFSRLGFYSFTCPQYREWERKLVKAAIEIAETRKIDILYTRSHPELAHIVGLEINKKYPELPWIAAFSDPWLDQPYLQYDRPVRRFLQKIEEKIMRTASLLVFTTHETMNLFRKKYGVPYERMEVLEHFYMKLFFDSCSIQGDGEKKIKQTFQEEQTERSLTPVKISEDRINIAHFGSLQGPRNIKPLLKAVESSMIYEETLGLPRTERISQKVLIHLIGNPWKKYEKETLPEYAREIIREWPSVSYVESLALMKKCDFLLAIDTLIEEGSVFMPSKLSDYFGARRPVIGVVPRAGAMRRIISMTGNYILDAEAPASLLDIIKSSREWVPRNYEFFGEERARGKISEIFSFSRLKRL